MYPNVNTFSELASTMNEDMLDDTISFCIETVSRTENFQTLVVGLLALTVKGKGNVNILVEYLNNCDDSEELRSATVLVFCSLVKAGADLWSSHVEYILPDLDTMKETLWKVQYERLAKIVQSKSAELN